MPIAGACKLLGADGSRLIQRGGTYDIDIDEQVSMDGKVLRVRLPEGVVTIALEIEAVQRLRWSCTACDHACEHVGAVLCLILEEKRALGLAAPPEERMPAESLSEEELVRQAIEERRERAGEEKMGLASTNPPQLWTDYTLTSAARARPTGWP